VISRRKLCVRFYTGAVQLIKSGAIKGRVRQPSGIAASASTQACESAPTGAIG
jgi:hypothetical protein